MNKKYILLLLFLLSSFNGCGGTDSGNPSTNVTNRTGDGCTLDLKTCSDGSSVVRDFNNNCEFKKCPDE